MADEPPVIIEIAPGADLSSDPGTWPWVDITEYWRVRTPITITEGRGDWGEAVDPGTCQLTLDNREGHFSAYNPLGRWYGLLGRDTPLRVSLDLPDGRVVVWGGYVPAWVPSWDQSGADRHVEVTAHGTLYRLRPAAGQPPELSPMRRTIAASKPVAYWPVEDGAWAGHVASALSGHPPIRVEGVAELRDPNDPDTTRYAERRYGSVAVADLSQGGRLVAQVPAEVTAATQAGWTVAMTGQVSSAASLVLLEVSTPGGTYDRWQVRSVSTETTLETQIAAFRGDAETLVASQPGLFVSYRIWDFSVWQDGPVIRAGVGHAWGTWLMSGSVSGTLAGVTSVAVNATGAATPGYPWLAGHVTVWSERPSPIPHTQVDPDGHASRGLLFSYELEAAHRRLERLGVEDGITVDVQSLDGRVEMGPQPPGTPLDLYRQCEQADGGVLFERPFGLAYTPRAHLYNQEPVLVLDWSAGDLAAAPRPDPYAQRYRNRITVSRAGGSSAVVQRPDAVLHDESVELHVAHDRVLADHAWWRLHLASHTGLRWSRIELDLTARPQYLADWLRCRVGSRIRIAHPPKDVADQDIDLMLEGWTLRLGYREARVDVTCSPYAPWRVAEAGAARAASEGSVLATDLPVDGMTMVIASTGMPWITDPADMPLVLRVGGEQVIVSSISGAGSPQSATIAARGVNGITREWPAGTPVQVWEPAIVPL